jgi:sialate O-acetylesterase
MLKNTLLGLISTFFYFSNFAFQAKNEIDHLKLSPLFKDHMVLQQQRSVPFWGINTPNEKVTVSTSWGKSETITTDSDGNWKSNILTPKAGGPYTINVQASSSNILISDVLIGEVWLASGQSNMEMPLKGWSPNDIVNNSEEEIFNADYPNIRMFTVERHMAFNPLKTINGTWQVANSETAGDFSATAYFFARKLYKTLNIPIGIIHSSWGGTPAEAWTSKAPLKTLEDFKSVLESIESQNQVQVLENWFSKWKIIPIPNTAERWHTIGFDDDEAAQPDYNDTHWSHINLPGRYDDIIEGEIDGVFWFRKKVLIENIETDYKLTIGAIDDMDATYVNGQKVGGLVGYGHSGTKREFNIPKSLLQKGENTIAIRAIDVGGPGSFSGPMLLSNSSGNDILLDRNWKYKLVAEIFKNEFYVYGINKSAFQNRTEVLKLHPKIPTVLFNAMIHPLIPYTVKGVIWYQGEENVSRAEQYKQLFPTMIQDWRKQWQDNFPFYFVQIAPFQYHRGNRCLDQSQKLREAQRLALKTENTGMVVTMDIGNFNNIHPSNKQDVGARLAGLALANDYGKPIVASGPLYKSFKISGNTLILDFDYVGSGLIAKGTLSGFEIADGNKKYVFAKAKIVGNKVYLFSPFIDKPQYARYAWRDKGIPSLFNKEGLPASSFTTEK